MRNDLALAACSVSKCLVRIYVSASAARTLEIRLVTVDVCCQWGALSLRKCLQHPACASAFAGPHQVCLFLRHILSSVQFCRRRVISSGQWNLSRSVRCFLGQQGHFVPHPYPFLCWITNLEAKGGVSLDWACDDYLELSLPLFTWPIQVVCKKGKCLPGGT